MRTLATIAVIAFCTTSSAQLFTATGATITIAGGAEVTVEGDVLLNTGATFDNEGSLRVEGDWTNNSGGSGVLPTGAGSVLLHGAAAQNIQGTAVTDFRNLIITGGNKVLVQNTVCGTPIQPDGTLTLDGAVLLLNGRTMSVFNPASSAVVDLGGSVRSESTDLLSRFQWAMGADITEHVIPFSTAAGAALPFAFTPTAPLPANTLVGVATYPTAPDNTVFPVTANQQVLNVSGVSVADNSPHTVDRFWLVDLPNGSFTGSMRLSYTPAEDAAFGPGPVRAQRWLESGSVWQYPPLPGQSNPATREVLAPNVLFTDAIAPTNEHIWALAYDNSPLPVELMHFSGTCGAGSVRLEWSTGSELNSARFMIERSDDDVRWVQVGALPAAGTSAMVTHYAFTDGMQATDDWAYYRLIEISTDGRATLLRSIAVPGCGPQDRMIVFPNPARTEFFVRIPSALADTALLLEVRDALGRPVLNARVPALAPVLSIDSRSLGAGWYTVVLLDGQGNVLDQTRLVVQN